MITDLFYEHTVNNTLVAVLQVCADQQNEAAFGRADPAFSWFSPTLVDNAQEVAISPDDISGRFRLPECMPALTAVSVDACRLEAYWVPDSSSGSVRSPHIANSHIDAGPQRMHASKT